MKSVILTQGKMAFIDDEDFDKVSKYKWFAVKNGNTFYAGRYISGTKNPRKKEWMHHLIMGRPDEGYEIDHRDGDGCNNQKVNMRIVTHRINMQNIINSSTPSSKYPGVSWHKLRNKWRSCFNIGNKQIHLGLFDNELDAYNKYKNAIENLENKNGLLLQN